MEQNNNTIAEQLGDINNMISKSYVARAYFGKSRYWLSQKLNGNIVNGKPAKFTPAELETLRGALRDMSEQLEKMSNSLI